jgi:hypothetical protein
MKESKPPHQKENARRRITLRATASQATPEHERRIQTAIQLLLAEWVRQRMAKGEDNVL